jgi:hypothetical protein
MWAEKQLPLRPRRFRLFNSRKTEYQALQKRIIDHLVFLRDKSTDRTPDSGLIRALYTFREVSQTWLGFSFVGNKGRGLGPDFVHASTVMGVHTQPTNSGQRFCTHCL